MSEIYIMSKDLSNWLKEKYFSEKDFYSVNELVSILEDIALDLKNKEKELENYKQYVEDNYKFMPTEEQIGYDRETW